MRKKSLIFITYIVICATSLFGFELDISNEIPAYEDLKITIEPSTNEGTIEEARLFFYQKGKNEPLYSEFEKKDNTWTTIIPYSYLEKDEEFEYFAVLKNTDDEIYRYPKIGNKYTKIIKDENAPSLKLISPNKFELYQNNQQLIVFEIIDESALASFDITVDNQKSTKAGAFNQYLSILIDTEDQKERILSIDLVDRYGNENTETFNFITVEKKEPFFKISSDANSFVEAEYIFDMGKNSETTNINDLFKDISNIFNINYGLSGNLELQAGPIKIDLIGTLGDSIQIVDILEIYPNTLQADLQNILNLYNPIDFENEFDYSNEVPRKFYNNNQMLLKFSILDKLLVYQFGDQNVDYQKETISKLNFRGSSLSIDIPILEINVSKGLTNLGLYQVSWPQNFLGLQFSLKAKEVWYFQTNLSFISSLQGTYNNLKISGATSDIGVLYGLDGINPEENFILGIGSGINTDNYNLDGSFSFSLYNEDSSSILDINQLVTDIANNSSYDLSTYIGYLDKIHSIIPVLDYFLPSNGLVSGAINKDLWGISYGLTLDLPKIGTETWIRKTDFAYRSLGASVPTDELSIGLNIENYVGDYSYRAGYSFEQDNIKDILLNEIIPLIKPSLSTTADVSESDIANQIQNINLGFDTPQYYILGTFSLDYNYLYAGTNSKSLISQTSDNTIITAIQNSTDNDISSTHSGEVRWRSYQLEIGKFSARLGAKFKEAYVASLKIDGVDSSLTHYETSYNVSSDISFDKFSLSLEYNNSFSTEVGSSKLYNYGVNVVIKDSYFDNFAFKVSLDQEYTTVLEANQISGVVTFEKEIGDITTSASLDVSYFDSLIDNTKDSFSNSFILKGVYRAE